MKKFLLLVSVALFSLGVSAQEYNINSSPMASTVKAKMADPSLLKNIKPKALTRAGETPEGERRVYFLNRNDAVLYFTDVYGLTFPHISKDTLIFAEDGTVYIPNMIYVSQFPERAYLVGKLNAAGTQISLEPKQVVGSVSGGTAGDIDVFVSAIDTYGNPLTTPIVLNVDQSAGVIYNTDNDFTLGLLATNMGQTQLLTYAHNFNYYPVNDDFFQAPVTRSATTTQTTQDNPTAHTVEYSVEDYNTALGGRFIKGLIPGYDNSWVICVYQGQSNNFSVGSQVLNDGILLYVNDSQYIDLNNTSLFNAGMGADTYSQIAGSTICDLYYYEGDQYNQAGAYNTLACTGITLGTPVLSGIEGVEAAGNDGEVVATEYYDLSGRRVSAAEKGITIKVEKYADGTSKAVKVMK